MAGQSNRVMLEAGMQAPEFSLRPLDGGVEVTLADLNRNGSALLVFYKASCPVCQLTLPYLESIRGGNITVVYISQDDESTTRKFMREFRLTPPVVLDESGLGYPASNSYGISSVPSIFEVQPGGRISFAWAGWSKPDMQALAGRAGKSLPREIGEVPLFRPG